MRTIVHAVPLASAPVLALLPGTYSDPEDFVRIEVASALSDRDTLVIPLLVEGAAMPGENELPDVLRPLAFRQALELTDRHWQADTRQLLDVLKRRLSPEPRGLWERLKGYWKLFPVRILAAGLTKYNVGRAAMTVRPSPSSRRRTFTPTTCFIRPRCRR